MKMKKQNVRLKDLSTTVFLEIYFGVRSFRTNFTFQEIFYLLRSFEMLGFYNMVYLILREWTTVLILSTLDAVYQMTSYIFYYQRAAIRIIQSDNLLICGIFGLHHFNVMSWALARSLRWGWWWQNETSMTSTRWILA